MDSRTNKLPTNNRLIDTAAISRDQSSGKIQISQKAEIGGREVLITLNFNKGISDDAARNAMTTSLEKVGELVVAYKLGQKNEQGETTHSLILHSDRQLTRKYTNENQRATEHTMTHGANEVNATIASTQEKTKEIASREVHAPVSVEINEKDDDLEEEEIERSNATDSTSSIAAETSISSLNSSSVNAEFPQPLPSRQSIKADPSSSPRGETFTDEFKVKNSDGNTQVLATEKAERAGTVDTLMKALKTNVEKLEEKIKIQGPSEELTKTLAKAKEDLTNYEKNTNGATHASTNMPRFAFKKFGTDAKEIMAPVLPNLRMQTVKNSEGKTVSAVTRSGAISDFSHGEVSLEELKDLENIQKYSGLSAERKLGGLAVADKIKLEKLYLTDSEKLSVEEKNIEMITLAKEIKIKALVGYGAKALMNPPSTELEELTKQIQNSGKTPLQAYDELSEGQKKLFDDAKIDKTKLDTVQSERRNKLKLLVLQDLGLHLKTTPAKGQSILYGRTSLLDFQKKSKNEHGFIMNERAQGLDMKAIFDELEGKEIQFDDTKDPYIDDKGAIHMPKEYSKDGEGTKTLNTVFFNVCVQGKKGHTANEGIQKNINDETLEKLKKKYQGTEVEAEVKALEASLKELDGKKDPNQSVLLMTRFLQKQEGYPGINCYGGKDRTGYCVALVTHSHLKELAEQEGVENKSQEKEWGHQLLSGKGIAGQIANDNADHTALKLSRKDLELYHMSSVKGKMKRASDVSKLGINILRNKITGTNSASSTPGQLYKKDPKVAEPSRIASMRTRVKSVRVSQRFMSVRKSVSDFNI